MKLHALYHVPFEDVGTIAHWARDRGHELVASNLYADDLPPDPAAYDLLLVMGGPMSVTEEEQYPWLKAEKDAIRAALDAGKGVLGVCLGAQLLAEVLGGRVTTNPAKEIGWFEVGLTPEGAAHPLFAGFPAAFPAFHWHGDTFSIPPGATRAAFSEACANQAFVKGDRVAGLQFHLETGPPNMANLIKHCRHELVPEPFIQTDKDMHNNRPSFPGLKERLYTLMDNLAKAIS